MFKFPPINIEIFLIRLKGNAVLDFAAEHHLVAIHEIVHDAFKIRHEGLWVDQEEVDFLIGGYLDSFITFYEVYETPKL